MLRDEKLLRPGAGVRSELMIAGNTCFHPHLASSTLHSTFHTYSIGRNPKMPVGIRKVIYKHYSICLLKLQSRLQSHHHAQFGSSAGARCQYEGGIMPHAAAQLSPFNKQEMHRYVCNHKEGPRENGQSNHILPECECIESKGTENRSPRNLDIESIFVVDQR